MYGDKLGATDGEIGHVKDFYFDDQNWAVRYVVVEAGSWLSGRQVLISPYSLGRLDQADKILRVSLTRKQIEGSPSIDSHKPISRQYEEEYSQYYDWPSYWQGGGLWGTNAFPILEPRENSHPKNPAVAKGPQLPPTDAHLRSTQAVNGYHVKSGNETIGHVCDFMMDPQSWAIGQLVVKTGHRISGEEILIARKSVERISYDESTIFVNLTREILEQPPAHSLAPVNAAR
jgi:hypothetical protein